MDSIVSLYSQLALVGVTLITAAGSGVPKGDEIKSPLELAELAVINLTGPLKSERVYRFTLSPSEFYLSFTKLSMGSLPDG